MSSNPVQLTTHVLQHDPLTPIDPNSTPTAAAIHRLRRELYDNVRNIDTTLGGGAHGHLGLLMPDDDYEPLAGVGNDYELPDRPAAPVYAGTDAQQKVQADEYKEELRIYNDAHGLHKQIKRQIIQAVPAFCIEHLADPLHGYATVSAQVMLDAIVTTFGKITNDDLEDNAKLLDAPWDPETPIQTLFTRITTCRAFAQAAGEQITLVVCLRKIIKVFENSGVFTQAVHDWKNLPEVEQTMENMRNHFTRADKDRKKQETSMKTTLTANAAQAKPKEVNSGGMGYCWTHGLGPNSDHTSATCTKPARGHNKEATMDNMLGGNNTIRRLNGERPIYAKTEPKRARGTKKEETKESKDE